MSFLNSTLRYALNLTMILNDTRYRFLAQVHLGLQTLPRTLSLWSRALMMGEN